MASRRALLVSLALLALHWQQSHGIPTSQFQSTRGTSTGTADQPLGPTTTPANTLKAEGTTTTKIGQGTTTQVDERQSVGSGDNITTANTTTTTTTNPTTTTAVSKYDDDDDITTVNNGERTSATSGSSLGPSEKLTGGGGGDFGITITPVSFSNSSSSGTMSGPPAVRDSETENPEQGHATQGRRNHSREHGDPADVITQSPDPSGGEDSRSRANVTTPHEDCHELGRRYGLIVLVLASTTALFASISILLAARACRGRRRRRGASASSGRGGGGSGGEKGRRPHGSRDNLLGAIPGWAPWWEAKGLLAHGGEATGPSRPGNEAAGGGGATPLVVVEADAAREPSISAETLPGTPQNRGSTASPILREMRGKWGPQMTAEGSPA
ncbi:uncharacterized protein LOC133348788 [Lethenteron reissneri]|uniref:uncharacterized protein LOC133348788 n=1 Tax=Lethenteron reissneri TaxID=7753 RepID=UPI002AB61894|nr:uncharacterized protein LOC133348788 [Lethenteron reissneri]XP_061417767.1 uncharacterized protein LOC133348788 [Lethenteron reissneri]